MLFANSNGQVFKLHQALPYGFHMAHEEANVNERFRTFANKIADKTGSAGAFGVCLAGVIVWAATGPLYHYSDSWQLVINTGTSVVTFLMVFLIQSTQNRDAQAMQLKLNELIRAVSTARNIMVDLENCSEEEIREIREEFTDIRARISARRGLDKN
jgi:low affinity Fe/Cu permease